MSSNRDSFEFSLSLNPLPAHMQECRLRKRFTDIIIKVGEEEFPTHKIVLEASSLVLRAWLADHWKKNDDIYELSEEFVDSDIVEDLLTFFYTAKVTITTENVYALCMASHYLNVTSLLEASERFLSERVEPENVLNLFLLADRLKLETLRKKSVDCVLNNHETVLKSNTIVTYSAEDLKLLITEINDNNEDLKLTEVLFECLMNWVETDLSARRSSLPSLLRSLPLTILSERFLSEVVFNQSVISESQTCSKLLNDALKEVSENSMTSRASAKRLQASKKYNSCKLYCFGGKNEIEKYLSSISCFDSSTGVWNTVGSMSTDRAYFGGAIIGEKIYLCGGLAEDTLDTLEVYDCSTNTSTQLRSMPEPRAFCAAAVLDEFVYVSGGRDIENTLLSSVLQYNISTDEWQEVKPMHKARDDHQLVALKGRLYAIGRADKTVEMYNPTTDQWSMKAKTHYEHPYFGATVHDGRIYVCSHNGFEVYSPDIDTWQTLTSLNEFYGKTLVSMNGKLSALGGSSQICKGSKSVYSYDLTSGLWAQELDMDIARGHHCSFVIYN